MQIHLVVGDDYEAHTVDSSWFSKEKADDRVKELQAEDAAARKRNDRHWFGGYTWDVDSYDIEDAPDPLKGATVKQDWTIRHTDSEGNWHEFTLHDTREWVDEVVQKIAAGGYLAHIKGSNPVKVVDDVSGSMTEPMKIDPIIAMLTRMHDGELPTVAPDRTMWHYVNAVQDWTILETWPGRFNKVIFHGTREKAEKFVRNLRDLTNNEVSIVEEW